MQREQPRQAPGPTGSLAPNTVPVERHLCDIRAVLEMTSPFLAPSRSLVGLTCCETSGSPPGLVAAWPHGRDGAGLCRPGAAAGSATFQGEEVIRSGMVCRCHPAAIPAGR